MTAHSLHSLTANTILAELPVLDLERIQQLLRPVLLHEGATLYQSNRKIDTMYFVTGGLLSGVLTAHDGKVIEVGMVGSEGMIGALEAITNQPTAEQWIVQIPGKALAMPANTFRQEFKRGGVLQDKTMCLMQQMLLQNAHCTLCNSMHTVEQRLARWLLMAQDRVRRNELDLTHEMLAQALGVRRSGVTIAAGVFKTAGLISYTRGTLQILDRAGLEATACECYQVIKHQGATHSSLSDAPGFDDSHSTRQDYILSTPNPTH
jgi:CRP-like cAMP-binding protein